MTTRRNKKRIIHVNQHNIRANIKNGENLPVVTCKSYNDNQYGHEVILKDSEGNEVGRFIYSNENPLSCGARVWFETHLDVEVVNHAN